jgi:hypothetical protein
MSELLSSLVRFSEQVNRTERLRSLLKGWDRVVTVEATDTGRKYMVSFVDTRASEPQASSDTAEPDISLKAEEQVLTDVFLGIQNPASLFLEGSLKVFASDKDQVRLDAITLILWD